MSGSYSRETRRCWVSSFRNLWSRRNDRLQLTLLRLLCAGWVCSQASPGHLLPAEVGCASAGSAGRLLRGLGVHPGRQCHRQEDGVLPLGRLVPRWDLNFEVSVCSLNNMVYVLTLLQNVQTQVRRMRILSSCTTWMKVFMAHSTTSCWETPSLPRQCTRLVLRGTDTVLNCVWAFNGTDPRVNSGLFIQNLFKTINIQFYFLFLFKIKQ